MAKRQTQVELIAEAIDQGLSDKVKVKGKLAACVAVAVVSVDAVDHREPLHTVSVAGHEEPEQIAETLYGIAQTNCSGSEDRATFEIVFFYGDDDKAKKPYKFYIRSQLAFGEHGADETTAKGILKQVIAEKNEVLKMCFAQMNVVNEACAAMVEASTKQIKVANDRADMAVEDREVAIKLLVQQEYVRESKVHEYRMAELEKQESAKWKALGLEMAPAFLNSFLKKPLLPESMGDTALLKMALDALEKMDRTVATQFIMSLPPHVQAPLMARGNQIREQAKAEQEAKRKALEAAGDVARGPETPVDDGVDPKKLGEKK
jgi:hypothetical protein